MEFRTEKDDFVVAFYRNLRETWNGNETSLKSVILVIKKVIIKFFTIRIVYLILFLQGREVV